MKKPCYYHLSSSTDDPCSMVRSALEQAKGTWLCSDCLSPKGSPAPIDAQIQELRPKDAPLNFIYNGIGIATIGFLQKIGKDVIERDLLIGRLYGPKGKLIENWVTFRGRHMLIIRGSVDASYRRCPECSRILYFALGHRYLFPSPPQGVDVFESDSFGLVLTENIFSRLTVRDWHNADLDELSVPKVPKDELGVLE